MKIRAADAKEVGVGNPAEETCCYPNGTMLHSHDFLSTEPRAAPELYAKVDFLAFAVELLKI